MLYVPMCFMFCATVIALLMSIYGIVNKFLTTGGFSFLTDGLQLIMAIALIVLALLIASQSVRKLFDSEATEDVMDSDGQEHHA